MTVPQLFKNTCICVTVGVFFLVFSDHNLSAAIGGAALTLGGCFLVGGVCRWLQENEPKRGG